LSATAIGEREQFDTGYIWRKKW